MPSKFEYLSLFVDIMSPRRGRDIPHRVLVNEELVSSLHAPPSNGDPPKFQIPLIPQAKLSTSMSLRPFELLLPIIMLRLKHKYKSIVMTPLGEQIIHTSVFRGC